MRGRTRSEEFQGFSRRDVIGMMGAASSAIAAGYTTIAKAASDRPAIAIEEVKDGRARIIARGSDAPSLRGQTVRSTIINADLLDRRPDVAARFMAAYRETIDWMYSDPDAVEMYARKLDKPPAFIRDNIRTFYPKEALQSERMEDTPGIVRDAVKLRYLRAPLTDAQLTALVRIPPRQ